MTRTGPIAAAIRAIFSICCCSFGLKLLNASIRSVTFSMKGWTAPPIVCPMLYLNTSKVDLSFSIEPPTPDMRASDMDWADPEESSMLLLRDLKSEGDASISVSHLAIWFLPKIADAADIFSESERPLKASCRSS